jgi:hypothetical protein
MAFIIRIATPFGVRTAGPRRAIDLSPAADEQSAAAYANRSDNMRLLLSFLITYGLPLILSAVVLTGGLRAQLSASNGNSADSSGGLVTDVPCLTPKRGVPVLTRSLLPHCGGASILIRPEA